MIEQRIEKLTEQKQLQKIIPKFIDVCSTATNRATHYDTKAEQQKAVSEVHNALFNIDRGLYGVVASLPGTMDYAKQLAIYNLLSNPRNGATDTLTDSFQEFNILEYLANTIETPRTLKTFIGLRKHKINNSRTKRLLLRTILNSDKLELWAVKYRDKLNKILEHCWGKRNTSIISSIIKKQLDSNTESPFVGDYKEKIIIMKNIYNYVNFRLITEEQLYQCISFIFGNENNITLSLLKSYIDSKQNIESGKKLPYETLQGIRSIYHPDFPAKDILALTKESATVKQQKNFQRKAKDESVELEFDPFKYDPVELYIYAYENGLTDEITHALKVKAKKAAENFILKYDRIGILVDNSFSASGDYTQKLRPMAITLATRDMLYYTANNPFIEYCNPDTGGYLSKPANRTNLAKPFIKLLMNKPCPDAIYIISDGYENAPAGRLAEVINLTKKIGINIPIYQFSPVTGSESFGIRNLSENITAIPVSNPKALGFSMLKPIFEQDLKQALWTIIKLADKNVKLLPERSNQE